MFEESRHRRSVVELQNISKNLHIDLKVAAITYEEFSRRLTFEEESIKHIYDEIHEDLVDETRGVMFRAYRNEKRNNPDITPESFLARYHDIHAKLEKWGIDDFIDYGEEKYTKSEFDNAIKKFDEKSKQTRRTWPKSKASLSS